MKINGCKYAPFTLKFAQPFAASKTVLSERKILFIKVQDENGLFSFGEAAPLPEFGSETFEETCKFLTAALTNLKGKNFTDITSVRQFLNSINPPAASRFALEEALLLLLANNNRQELISRLKLNVEPSIRINAVLGFMDADKYIPKITGLLSNGFSTAKIKIGRDDFDEDLHILQNIRKHFGNKISIRADVNGKWELKEAIKNIQRLDELELEYIEQPVNALEEFKELKGAIRTPVAADESIRNVSDAREFIMTEAADYIVLKPMLTGGALPALDILNEAKRNNIKTVLSSSFETILGSLPSLLLASALDADIAHGFNIFNYFENDPFGSAPLLKSGVINLNDIDLQNIYSVIEKNIILNNA
jgi:o-succinylbenzoate synthase